MKIRKTYPILIHEEKVCGRGPHLLLNIIVMIVKLAIHIHVIRPARL
jgi:hypothetical protein